MKKRLLDLCWSICFMLSASASMWLMDGLQGLFVTAALAIIGVAGAIRAIRPR